MRVAGGGCITWMRPTRLPSTSSLATATSALRVGAAAAVADGDVLARARTDARDDVVEIVHRLRR